METEKNQDLWRIAKKRVGFKRHLATYIGVNAMLWALWLLSEENKSENLPWPVWPMLGWGIGLFFDYLGAYREKQNPAVEKEYEKLLRERQ